MGLYFSGSAGYGLSVDYTGETFAILKEYYEQKTGKNWDWEDEGADKDFICGVELFPGVYVHSLSFEDIAGDYLYIIASETKIDIEKNSLQPTPIKEPKDFEALSVLYDLAALYEVELSAIIFTDYS